MPRRAPARRFDISVRTSQTACIHGQVDTKIEGMFFLIHGIVAVISAEDKLIAALRSGSRP